MVNESLNNEFDGGRILESLKMKRADFIEFFKQTAHDAVKDYLKG